MGRIYIALPWNPKVVELCIVHLSMSELSGFADDLTEPFLANVKGTHHKSVHSLAGRNEDSCDGIPILVSSALMTRLYWTIKRNNTTISLDGLV